jgi:stage II sporulation protein M
MRKEKKRLSMKRQFAEARVYVGETKNYIYASVLIFAVGAVLGFVLSAHLTFIDQFLAELLEKTQMYGTVEMIFFILQNNLQSSFFSVVFGIVLGIFPLMGTVSNGVILGYVLARAYEAAGLVSWWRLLPHGIFELPAIFISFGMGIKLGLSIFLNKKTRVKEFKRRFYNSMNAFLMIIIPLLIIAAIIEGVLIGVLG